MNINRWPLAWFIYVAVRAAFAVMQIFPIDWNLGTARIVARLWPVVLPRHRRRTVEHLRAALGKDLEAFEIERVADQCLESVTKFAVEAICLPRLINSFTWRRYIRLANFDETLKLILEGRGLIFVTGHFGSFEVSAHVLALLGFEVLAVMRPLDNPYLNRFMVQTRRTHGLRLIDKKGATRDAEESLDRGGLLAFVGDQDAGRKGIFVDFFGRPASTYKSIGLLAMDKKVPIVVGYSKRLGHQARYEVGVERVIRPEEWMDRADPLKWITQSYTSAIEASVRAAPGQYLWIHRRWKSQPMKIKLKNRLAVEEGTERISDAEVDPVGGMP